MSTYDHKTCPHGCRPTKSMRDEPDSITSLLQDIRRGSKGTIPRGELAANALAALVLVAQARAEAEKIRDRHVQQKYDSWKCTCGHKWEFDLGGGCADRRAADALLGILGGEA